MNNSANWHCAASVLNFLENMFDQKCTVLKWGLTDMEALCKT